MTFLLGVVIGAVGSYWLETLLTRVALRLPLPEGVRGAIRQNAKGRIDTQEKGRIMRLSDADAADALARPGILFNELERHDE
jgi:hypothetical protein